MSNLAILVLSCDKYSGLWDLFFSRWHKFWPDCEHRVYLLSNQKLYQDQRITTICTGEDKDWSSNLQFALDIIDADNILLMIEDAPLDQKVENIKFVAIYERFCLDGMNYLNLKAEPLPRKGPDPLIGVVPPGALYRAALVPSIWKKDVLNQLIVAGESAWQFEIRGSERSDRFDGFYSLHYKFFNWIHCVIQGKLDLRAVGKLTKSGELSMVQFEHMSNTEYMKVRFQEFRSSIYRLTIPYQFRRVLRSFYYRLMLNKSKLI